MNGLLIVDKAIGPTSHDVVARARRALGTRAVGHAGTLDPAASGVLVLAVGEATKLVAYLTTDDKEYETTVLLGRATNTADAAGTMTAEATVPALTLETITTVLRTFVGTYPQQVPAVSAVKVGGERLHKKARRGDVGELPVREVTCKAATLLSVDGPHISVCLWTGKGFYVRSFAEDFGRALGTVAHVSTLRRLRSGEFTLDIATPYATLELAATGDAPARASLAQALVGIRAAWGTRPILRVTDAALLHARHGRAIPINDVDAGAAGEPGQVVACVGPDDELVALAMREESSFRVIRGFAPISGDDAPRPA